jgi:hypothetical protein
MEMDERFAVPDWSISEPTYEKGECENCFNDSLFLEEVDGELLCQKCAREIKAILKN